MKRQLVALGSVVVLAAVLVAVGTGTHGADHAGVLHPSRVVRASGADRSLPLRDLTAAGGESADPDQADAGGKRPSHEGDEEDDLHRPAPRTSGSAAHERDAALQSSSAYHASATASPPAMPNFNGLNNARNPSAATNITPPDTNIAVGTHYILEAVNQSIAVYSKGGALRSGFPKKVNALWSGFNAGPECRDLNDGDPVVFYDQLADRYVVSQFALHLDDYGSGLNAECIAVSVTGDPSGSYYRYQFDYPNGDLNDYPKFGLWPDAYYATFNNFTEPDGAYDGIGVVAYDRTKMLTGDPTASFVQFDVGPSTGEFGALPATLDGTTLPPNGAPEPIVQQQDDLFGFPHDEVLIRRFHVDFTTPASSTLTDPPIAIQTMAFDSNMCNYQTNCVKQPKTTSGVDAISDRLMYRASYRELGTRNSLLLSQTVDARGDDVAGIRWTEVRNASSGTPSIRQQKTYSPSTTSRWLGSIAQDRFGDVALAYNASSASVYPSIFYTGRHSSDALAQMTLAEQKLVSGTGSQTSTHHRWGDYSDLTLDPIDDCTFWYSGQYYAATTTTGWRTRIGSFRFGSCIPKVSVADATVAEGNSGQRLMTFTVGLSAPSSQTVTVHFATSNGSATAPSDYLAASGTITFKPGETSHVFNVRVNGDTSVEPDETMAVTLSSATNGSILDGHAVGRITNDD